MAPFQLHTPPNVIPAKADASEATDEVNPGSTTSRLPTRWREHLHEGRNQIKPVLYVISLAHTGPDRTRTK